MKKALVLFTIFLSLFIFFLAGTYISQLLDEVDSRADVLVDATKNQKDIELDPVEDLTLSETNSTPQENNTNIST